MPTYLLHLPLLPTILYTPPPERAPHQAPTCTPKSIHPSPVAHTSRTYVEWRVVWYGAVRLWCVAHPSSILLQKGGWGPCFSIHGTGGRMWRELVMWRCARCHSLWRGVDDVAVQGGKRRRRRRRGSVA